MALVLRTLLVLYVWRTHPFVRTPILDGEYYLRWAGGIASGDVAGTQGIVGGAAWVLNPLYAYLLAPFLGLFREPVLPILLAQGALGAATTALAAASATRTFDARAGWIAGLLVAFSAPLAQLDTAIAVVEVAAFLVAGACFACAPAAPGDRKGAHGPVAAALWLGIGALARPVTVLALPFVAWRFARESTRRVRTLVVAGAVFAACAVPGLVRNWAVSGEPIVYTASAGINAHFGNNPDARRDRAMMSTVVRFHPEDMYGDARRVVGLALGHAPTAGEISSWFWARTRDEIAQHPAESAAHYANKARWFLGPVEVPSTASLTVDRWYSPWLRAAFVPTWLVAALAIAGLWAWRRRADVLLGPGAIVVAHWATLTLVFPLSHYRAPAIPAMAILAGGALTAVGQAFRTSRRGAAAAIVGVAAAAAAVGAAPPGLAYLPSLDAFHLGLRDMQANRLVSAEDRARESIALAAKEDGNARGEALAWRLLGQVLVLQGRVADGGAALDRSLALEPADTDALRMRSAACEMVGDRVGAERDARAATVVAPNDPEGWMRLGVVLAADDARADDARAALRRAIELGGSPDQASLVRLGMSKSPR